MKTKLIYVLTCSESGTYIEQALMSIWSARHHNPDAHIVLLTDDKTDRLLTGTRGGLLDYVTEKIVVPFVDENASMMFRSRWIKTSARELVEGDFLFIDCDTIVCKSLAEIDGFQCEMGAVWESHLLVEDFCDSLKSSATKANLKIGVDLEEEKEYFSSGVIYVKDSPLTHRLYVLWHEFWLESFSLGLPIDQPALAKANRECGHVIKKIPDTYNCILFTQNNFTDEAHVLHIAAYKNPSFLFTDLVLGLLKREGLIDWLKGFILRPCDSMLPFDYSIRHSSIKQRLSWIRSFALMASTLANKFPVLLDEFFMKSLPKGVAWLINKHGYTMAAVCWMGWKRLYVLKKKGLKDNICRK